MNKDEVKTYLLQKPMTEETFPFGPEVSVFKVKGKMFATLALGKMGKGDGQGNHDWWMNLKCDPDEAFALRDIFKSVIPGYHMNKRHWNTIILDGTIPRGEIERMIDNSFELVVDKLPKKTRLLLETR